MGTASEQKTLAHLMGEERKSGNQIVKNSSTPPKHLTLGSLNLTLYLLLSPAIIHKKQSNTDNHNHGRLQKYKPSLAVPIKVSSIARI